jgi:hypothetical protein
MPEVCSESPVGTGGTGISSVSGIMGINSFNMHATCMEDIQDAGL